MDLPVNQIICGDCLDVMKDWPDKLVDCCVTSPPYWGLRDYGVDGQLGLEKTPEEYVEKMVEIFQEVKRVLRPDGTLWLNMGDSYAGSGQGYGDTKTTNKGHTGSRQRLKPSFRRDREKVPVGSPCPVNLKPKDLCGMPWRLAFALQADGWYLRQDIIWHKPNPMPESVTDRCTKAHEYIFLLSKNPRYYYDADAIKEESINDSQDYSKTHKLGNKRNPTEKVAGFRPREKPAIYPTRNKRSVWTVTTKPYSEAHFATFPPDLIKPCILAGCPEWICKKCGKARVRIWKEVNSYPDNPTYKPRGNNRGDSFVKNAMTPAGETQGHPNHHYENKTTGWTDCGCNAGFRPGVVLDPFMGSGTTAMVAYENRRNYVGVELNPEYIKLNRADKAKEKYGLFDNDK